MINCKVAAFQVDESLSNGVFIYFSDGLFQFGVLGGAAKEISQTCTTFLVPSLTFPSDGLMSAIEADVIIPGDFSVKVNQPSTQKFLVLNFPYHTQLIYMKCKMDGLLIQ